MNLTLLIAILVGIAVFTTYLAVYNRLGKRQRIDNMRMDDSDLYTPTGNEYPGDGETDMALVETRGETAAGIESFFSIFGTDIEAYRRETRNLLAHAGIRSPDAPAWYLLYRRVIGPLIAVIGGLCFLSEATGLEYLGNAFVGLFLIVVGLFGAQLYVSNKRTKREKTLTRSFPDMLDLLVVCVESGLALDAALNRVTAELGRAHPVVTGELNQTRLELALLNDRTKALQNLADRTDLIPFRSLVAALIQTERFGTSLTDTLRVLSDDYRQRRLMIAEEKAGRLPALLTIPLICMLLPAMFIIILAPAFIQVSAQGGIFGSE